MAWKLFRKAGPAVLPAALLLLIPVLAWGSDVVGWVQKAEGQVSLVDGAGAARPAQAQAEIMADDTVATGPDGRTQIIFTDMTMLALGEDSRLAVRDALDLDGGGELNLEMIQGVARVLTSEVVTANPDKFRLETPLGRIGIRGTEFGSLVDADHEAHMLYKGGPVVYTDEQNLGGYAALQAEACQKLDKAESLAKTALAQLSASRMKDKQTLTRQMSDIEDMRAELGCGQ